MKTIRQIADKIGVSKQAVYKRVKGSLHTVVAPYTHTVDGIVYISEQGEKLIFQAFSKNTAYENVYSGVCDGVHTRTHLNDDEILFLREQNKTLFEQLTKKDKQLEDERTHSREQANQIADLANQLAELNRNNQILLSGEQTRNKTMFLTDNEESVQGGNVKKKGFFRRLFGAEWGK